MTEIPAPDERPVNAVRARVRALRRGSPDEGAERRSQTDLASDLGLPRSTIVDMENPRPRPKVNPRAITVDELVALAYVLDVSPVALLRAEDMPRVMVPAPPQRRVPAERYN